MLYDVKLKKAMLSALENRALGIADCIQALAAEGYIVNRNKKVILDWTIILSNAFTNIDIFNAEQIKKLNTIFNKVLKL